MFLKKIKRALQDKKTKKNWEKAGKPVPPPHLVKQAAIKLAKNKYGYNTFIETGTYLGEMVEAQLKNFNKIYSIELSENLFNNAKQKFVSFKHVKILWGDSSDVLKDIMLELTEPAMFWLDGHYSEGITARGKKYCPILEELTAIFDSKPIDHLIMIDDARLFIGQDDYPTVSELREYILTRRPSSEITIKDDIISVVVKCQPRQNTQQYTNA